MTIITPSKTSSLGRLNRILSGSKYSDARYFILVDENTYSHCLAKLISNVEQLQSAEFFEVPVGEECKDIAIAQQLWETLLESDADRNTIIVNLGGGCVSDLGGFVAAGYKRGIRYINIPTSLIGMIDASIGGKTAVNVGASKNQVGFFLQPEITCIHPAFLDTLPDEEIFNGIFEMLKTFLIADPEKYHQLCEIILSGTLVVLPEMITACAEIKAAVVKQDPEDRSIRHILNFGHTFGHAIESFSRQPGQKPLPHGMAVGIGMVCALYLSVQKLGLGQEHLEYYRQVASKLVKMPQYSLADTEQILAFMRQDKKNADGEIRCVLMQELGAPVIDLPIDENELRTALLKIQ
ncbi:MAG: 3-dehydroquinate synthase [Bacteroidales bacterium]|nr:3-dehydroquinate synthase [Candidatus Colimorpha merdihippi]